MRRMLYVAGCFVLIAGFQLFVLTDRTEDFFAWTIDPPLTAAFLGAGYWSSAILELGSARRPEWSGARLAMPTVLFFTTITLVLSLVHIDKFHTDSVFGIAWLVVYAAFPVAMATILILQARASGGDVPRRSSLPTWMRLVLAVQAVILFALGAYLYAAPVDAASLWPWPLTPLTGRAVGAWLLGTGFIAAHVAIENARERVDIAAAQLRRLRRPPARGRGSLLGHAGVERARSGGVPGLPGHHHGRRAIRLAHANRRQPRRRSQLQRRRDPLAGPVEPAHHRSRRHAQEERRICVGHARQVDGRHHVALVLGQLGDRADRARGSGRPLVDRWSGGCRARRNARAQAPRRAALRLARD